MPLKQRELARSAATRPQSVSAKTAALLELGETRRRRGGRRGGSRHWQVAVEAHGDDTKKQSSARRCTDEGAACGREAVLDERAQPLRSEERRVGKECRRGGGPERRRKEGRR